MKDDGKILPNQYCLRYAGGIYWLIDCMQPGVPYKDPLPLNEVGADIWKLFEQGKSEAEVVDCICAEYGVGKDTVQQDVEQFKKQLLEMSGEIYE